MNPVPRVPVRPALLAAVLASAALACAASAAEPIFESKVVTVRTPGHSVAIDVELPDGARQLHLVVTDGGDGFSCDWADWIAPRVVTADGTEHKLTERKWRAARSDWGNVRVGANAGGGTLMVNGRGIDDGIGTHANSVITFDLPEGVRRFRASGGLDNGGTDQGDGTASSVVFAVFTADPKAWLAKNAAAPASPSGDAATRDPADAVGNLDVHPDLEAVLFASEPMVLSPSAIDVDHRGRVWVCEVVNYRGNQGKRPEGDRLLILEDSDGDGTADRSTVFHQGADVDSAHGICVLGDRVIVSAGDDVFSLFDDDGDDRADRKELLFTKIGGRQHDHGIHAFHFGPDGRLYFNFGNAARQLCDKDGNVVVDLAGNPVRADRRPYQQGMIFRCNPDGSDVETLAWNFRNNWEVAVDSFGALWQSDNDDDGNRGVRINRVLEFGNYGYVDELTGAGWRDERPGMHEEIPLRHWHLNDPGVVPNLLQTGAGSPTGICVYEGDLLPPVFHGQPIHCDAGPNVVRAYVTEREGAGFRAEIVDLLVGTRDRWFRPSDVCVAPDGSLIVADWYDPGVGGHGMGDIERGRIFRVTPKGKSGSYRSPAVSLDSPEGALAALASPNEAARFLGWTALEKAAASGGGRERARRMLADLAGGDAPAHLRARAQWLLARIDRATIPAPQVMPAGPLQVAAVRMAMTEFRDDPEALLARLADTPASEDPHVRAQAAIALRFLGSAEADRLWAALARRHPAGDRWSLEALGIGADLHWESRLAAYLEAVDEPDPEILWRSRAASTAGRLAQLALAGDSGLPAERLIRAFHFLPEADGARRKALARLFDEGDDELAFVIATKALDSGALDDRRDRLAALARARRGTPALVELVTRFGLEGFDDDLVAFIAADPGRPETVAAARALLARPSVVDTVLAGSASEAAAAMVAALGATGDPGAIDRLGALVHREDATPELARAAVAALASSGAGEQFLLAEAREDRLPEQLRFTAAAALGRSRNPAIRQAAIETLDLPPAAGIDHLPPVPELVRMRGNAGRGKTAFTTATCATCHVVGGEGIAFGPDLSQIGNKLSKEALIESILYPSNAISHGFHGTTVVGRDGSEFTGIVTSETDDDLTLGLPGGLTRTWRKPEIAERREIDLSLMPPGLAAVLDANGFADLISYLESLR